MVPCAFSMELRFESQLSTILVCLISPMTTCIPKSRDIMSIYISHDSYSFLSMEHVQYLSCWKVCEIVNKLTIISPQALWKKMYTGLWWATSNFSSFAYRGYLKAHSCVPKNVRGFKFILWFFGYMSSKSCKQPCM